MKGACAIVADEDRAFVAFAKISGKRIFFIREADIPLRWRGSDIRGYLRDGLDILDKTIGDIERRHSFRVERVFVQLPIEATQLKTVCDTVALRRRKRITAGDIEFAKKYLEDKFLEWDDRCIHNVALGYRAEGASFRQAPLGVWSRKIEMNSSLAWVKDALYRDMEDIFDTIDRHFGGFIAPQIAAYASVFTKRDGLQAVMVIDYGRSFLVVSDESGLRMEKQYNFGFKHLIDMLAKSFTLDVSLADELFRRHVSFKEIPYFKEVTLKKKDTYVNVSTQSLNVLVKECIRQQVHAAGEYLKTQVSHQPIVFSCIGRLGAKEGFFSFIKECLPFEFQLPLQSSTRSSSYGCLCYGLRPFLENEHRRDTPLLKRIIKTYRDYF